MKYFVTGATGFVGEDLSMPIKDAFEMLVKIFHRDGTQFVKDPYDQATIKYTCSLHVSMLFLISATQDSFSHTAIKIEITPDILEG